MVQTLSIRTKLIMAMLSLVASVALMGVTAHDAHAQVTEIRKVYNGTYQHEVYIWNRESGKRMHIAPRTIVSLNEWVPWATNADEFNRGKFIEVGYVESEQFQCGGVGYCPKFAIWQEARNTQPWPGNFIRYSWTLPYYPLSYSPYAPPMRGESSAGGRRDLYIYTPVPEVHPSLISMTLATAREE